MENNRHAFETGLMHTNMAVKLINHLGIEYEFISMSRAGKFLGRSHSYISDKIKVITKMLLIYMVININLRS